MRQQSIPGTQPNAEPSIPEIDDAIDAWLESKHEQKTAADTTAIRHASLLERLAAAGLERYPFIDPQTGKKKHVVCDRTPKAKMVNAPRRERDAEDEEPGDEVAADDAGGVGVGAAAGADSRVEHRKVSRASVESEIDPFASTRRAMDDDQGGGVH